MKIQDFIFAIILIIGFLVVRRPKYFLIGGCLSLLLAMPLFAKWIFFTAERLTWYAASLLLIYLLYLLREVNS